MEELVTVKMSINQLDLLLEFLEDNLEKGLDIPDLVLDTVKDLQETYNQEIIKRGFVK